MPDLGFTTQAHTSAPHTSPKHPYADTTKNPCSKPPSMAKTKQATKSGDNITPVRHDVGDPQSMETDDQGRPRATQHAEKERNKEEGSPKGRQSKFEGHTASHDTTTLEDQVGVADAGGAEPGQQDTPSQGGGGQEEVPQDAAASKGLSKGTVPQSQQSQGGSASQHSRACVLSEFGGARDEGWTDLDASRNQKWTENQGKGHEMWLGGPIDGTGGKGALDEARGTKEGLEKGAGRRRSELSLQLPARAY